MNAALKIHSGDAEADPLQLPIADFFEQHVAPEMVAKKQATKLRQYRCSIARFTEFLANAANTSSIRGIAEISDLDAVQWQSHEQENGLKASTINVHWRRIRAVMRRAGPPEKGNPKGLGLIDRVPYLEPLPLPKPRPKVVSLDTIDAIYRYGCPDMPWPPPSDGVSASLRWRCWLVCAYNLAMRTRDLLGLRWDNIHWDPHSLDPDSPNESPHGWVEWVPQKTAGKKPDPLVLPLNATVRAHLESIHHDGEYIFGSAMGRVSNDKLYGRDERPGSGEWPRLIDLAATHVKGGIRRFEIRALRATANTAYNRLDRKLGAHILGHAPRGVNDLFYQQWESDVVEYCAQLPQPKSFLKAPAEPFRQHLLF